jgi:hypothetical protein
VECAEKSEIHEWKNAKGNGRIFTIQFCDASGSIKAIVTKTINEKRAIKFPKRSPGEKVVVCFSRFSTVSPIQL